MKYVGIRGTSKNYLAFLADMSAWNRFQTPTLKNMQVFFFIESRNNCEENSEAKRNYK